MLLRDQRNVLLIVSNTSSRGSEFAECLPPSAVSLYGGLEALHLKSRDRNRMRAKFALALSFLVQATAAVPLGEVLIQSVAQPSFHIRHCSFVAYAVAGYPGDGQDFNFTLVPGTSPPCPSPLLHFEVTVFPYDPHLCFQH